MKSTDVLKNNRIIDVLEKTLGDPTTKHIGSPNFKKSEEQQFFEELESAYASSKKFIMNVEGAQNVYSSHFAEDQSAGTGLHIMSMDHESYLPFPQTTFVFERAIEIYWSLKDKTIGDHHPFKEHYLIAFTMVEVPIESLGRNWQPSDDDSETKKGYRAYLHFLEDDQDEAIMMVSSQYIEFVVSTIHGDHPLLWVAHWQHLCSDSQNCEVADIGTRKDRNVDLMNDTKYCQEYANRKAVVSFMLEIVAEVYDREILHVKRRKTLWDYLNGFMGDTIIETRDPQLTPKALPEAGYTSYLNDKAYIYDKVNHGTGTKHRFRYDVRRHPRIVNNRIVWIEPHQRGTGEYIPKIYAKHKMFTVPYVVEKVQGLSRFRWIELLMIAIIRFRRRLK